MAVSSASGQVVGVSGRVWRLAVAALVALLLVGCAGGEDGAGGTTTTEMPGPVELGPEVDLGAGVVVGAHPRLPLAYVSAVDPAAGVGCEGADVEVLWVQPSDGGTRRRAVPSSTVSGRVVPGGADGEVVVVDQCEGYLSELGVGVPDAAGTLAGFRVVEPDTKGLPGELDPHSLTWAANGRSLLAVAKVVQPDDAPAKQPDRIVRIGLDGAVTATATAIGVIGAVELDDGRIVRASNETVRIGDEPIAMVAVASLALSPDRRRVAVFGDDGVHVLEPGKPLRKVRDDGATVGSWSPDGRFLAYLRLAAGDGVAVDLFEVATGQVVTVAARGGFTAPAFTADSATLLYDRAIPSGKGYDEPHATARRIRA